MKSLRNILRLLIVSGVLTAGALTVASIWGSHSAEASAQRALVAKDVTADILPPPMYLIELRLVLSEAVEGSMPLATAQAEITRLEKEYADRVAYWSANPPYGLETHILGPQHEAGRRFIAAAQPVLAALSSGDTAGAQAALKKAHVLYGEHRAGVDASVKASSAFAESALSSLASIQSGVRAGQWLVFGLSAALLVALGMYARKTVWAATGGEPEQAAAIANAVARGDLSVYVPVASGDESSVMAAMARMCRNLAGIVSQVRDSSHNIASGSTRIAEGNLALAQRTEEQTSALQETSASMEQLGTTVRHNADHAMRANQLAHGASEVAERGGEVVGRVVGTMRDINERSKKIADIIGVIDGIAFQTNILALNAAVEAARAGEQGRGFAVVAGEVRTLAQRSAEAAREIKALITASVERVEQGTELVDQAGVTMTEVVAAIKRVTGIMSDISGASTEQSSGVAHVTQAVNRMDQATRRNAALVNEGSTAVDGLRQHAERLAQAMSVFRLAKA